MEFSHTIGSQCPLGNFTVRVTDLVGVDPDPTFKLKLDPDPTITPSSDQDLDPTFKKKKKTG